MPNLSRSGLIIASALELEKLRRIPPTGQVIVQEGEGVDPDQIVGYLNPHGYVFTVNLAAELSVSPFDVPDTLLLPLGSEVRRGEVIAVQRSFYTSSEYASPEDGVIEQVSSYTGRVTIRAHPIAVRAVYPGVIKRIVPGEGAVITTRGALIQGIFGIGGIQTGRLIVITDSGDSPLTPDLIKPEHEGCILAGGCDLSIESLERARRIGVKGIVSGSMHKSTLDHFLGYNLGTAVTGLEKTFSVMLTEGFGKLPMLSATYDLLSNLHDLKAIISGATQVRAGVIRPELFVPHPAELARKLQSRSGELVNGQRVRLIRTPRFGKLAVVVDSNPVLYRLSTESEVLCVKVRLQQSGEEMLVPVANLETIE